MNIWTTFSPRKTSWELTCILSKGKNPSSDWRKNSDLIDEVLKKLKYFGISGIRLAIFPSELTNDGKKFDWTPIDKMLSLSDSHGLLVDLCVGPFQYPHYPGVYLPPELTKYAEKLLENIDDNEVTYEYGLRFLKAQMEYYRSDRRIHGFHLGNEWPDKQRVEDVNIIRLTVSEEFMLNAASLIKKLTSKPILINTNIDVLDKNKILKTFSPLLQVLGDQGKLGFDIYPSQSTWEKAPDQKLRNLIWSYSDSFKNIQKDLQNCEMYFAEVEAQPWGGGQSWYELINNEQDPNHKVLRYTNQSLSETWKKYINGTNCQTVSLWGSDFWLSANAMGINWPLEQINRLK